MRQSKAEELDIFMFVNILSKFAVAAGKEKGLNDMKNPLKQAVSEDFGAGYEKDEFALLAVGAEP